MRRKYLNSYSKEMEKQVREEYLKREKLERKILLGNFFGNLDLAWEA